MYTDSPFYLPTLNETTIFMRIMRSLVFCFILASVAYSADSTVLRAHAFTLYGDP